MFLIHGGGADDSLLLLKIWSSQFSLTFESLINIYAVRPILCYTFTYTWSVQNWSVKYNLTEICIGQHCSLVAWRADDQLYLVLWIQHWLHSKYETFLSEMLVPAFLVSWVRFLLFIAADQGFNNELDGHFVDAFYIFCISVTKSHLHCLQEWLLNSLKQHNWVY